MSPSSVFNQELSGMQKKQKTMTSNLGRCVWGNQSIPTNPEMTVVMKLVQKDLKAAITNFIKLLKDIGKHENDEERNRKYIKHPNETYRDEQYLKKINTTRINSKLNTAKEPKQ